MAAPSGEKTEKWANSREPAGGVATVRIVPSARLRTPSAPLTGSAYEIQRPSPEGEPTHVPSGPDHHVRGAPGSPAHAKVAVIIKTYRTTRRFYRRLLDSR